MKAFQSAMPSGMALGIFILFLTINRMQYFTSFCVRDKRVQYRNRVDNEASGIVRFSLQIGRQSDVPSAEAVLSKLPSEYRDGNYEVIVSDRGTFTDGAEATEHCPFALHGSQLRVNI